MLLIWIPESCHIGVYSCFPLRVLIPLNPRSSNLSSFVLLEKRNPLPTDDASKAKCLDAVAKRLEALIFKMAMTKVYQIYLHV